MNIYVTSYGLDSRYQDYMNSYKDIIKVLKGKRVAILPNVKLASDTRMDAKTALEELSKNEVVSKIIDLEVDSLNLEEYNALYLSGGEPKRLMDAIINSGNLEKIKCFIDDGGIVIGQSAGAMIFNKEYLDTTTGDLLVMGNGFDYFDKIIVPHYDHLPEEILDKLPDNILKVRDTDNLYKLK